MKKKLRLLVSAALGALIAIGSTSCYYDPYAPVSTTVGGSYSSGGYGDGYGYGGSSFSTSVFVSTGDPQWGYDPYCYSYYDYRSRRYYDPYLNGYYPIGYRPPIVYGVPHPGGWRPGRGYCPPPRYVSHGYVSNYRNREDRYRNSNYGWAKQVRQRPMENRVQGNRPSRDGFQQNNGRPSNNGGRPQNTGSRPSDNGRPQGGPSRQNGGYTREGQTRNNPYTQQNYRPQNGSRTPERYNSPVYSQQQQGRPSQRPSQGQRQPTQNFGGQRPQQNYGGQGQQSQRPQQQNNRNSGKKQSRDGDRVQGYR